MKRVLPALLVTGLAATWVGCQASIDTPPTVSTPTTQSVSDATSSEFTLVSLKVPNMT